MSELAIFSAELERLEREGRWDDPGYDYLASKVEELQAAEKVKPQPAQAPAAGQPQEDLASRMLAMSASPWKYSDEQHVAVVAEYNQAVISAGQQVAGAERVDVAALARDMAAANADPHAPLDVPGQLVRRYNQAVRQDPAACSTEELRADLASQDLGTRMAAALELQARNEELPEGMASKLVGEDLLVWQAQQLEAARDPANYSPEMRPVVEALQQAEEAQQQPVDPTERAIGLFNEAVRRQRPQSLEEQLEAVGVSAEPAGAGDE